MKSSRSLFVLFLVVSCLAAVSFSQSATNKLRGDIQTDRPALTRELTAQVVASRRAPDAVTQRWLVAQPGVKIAVKQEGMYRVTRSELQSAGFPVDSDSANWRLFVDGNEQAIIVGDGGQYIDFYGRGIDTFETDTRIYYLISDTAAGRRMESKTLRPIGGNVVSASYRSSAVKKDRRFYIPEIQNGDLDNYFGLFVVSDPSATERITLAGVDPQGPDALLRIDLQGYTYMAHSVRVVINGNDVGVFTGSGVGPFGGDFIVPQNLLVEGVNSITLTAFTTTDFSFFDSATITYSRRYAADQNRLSFHTPGYRKVDLTGFTSPNIRVFDTTRDGDPQMISNPVIVQNGGSYTASLPSDRPAVFYAVEDSALLHSPSVTFDEPSNLASPDNAAGMIIVSYSSPDMMAAAETWANYRRSEAGGGFTVNVVNIADIYDEFSYGLHTAQAIKDFLAYARQNWQTPAPAYVLLLGDASYDRRNYEGYGYWDMVPSKNVSFAYEEASSDDALVDFNNDGLADMAVGRITARSGSEALVCLSKTVSFETPANQSLYRGALFAYVSPLSHPEYEETSRQFRSQLPRGIPVSFIPQTFARALNDSPGQQDLIDGINRGNYIDNFTGPGATGIWIGQGFFGLADVPRLTNAETPSIFTALGDFMAFFTPPNNDTLGEALVKAPNGGAVANWGAVTVTTLDNQTIIGKEFYRLLAAGSIHRMGDLINASKANLVGNNEAYGWVLLGDPALKVR